LVDLIRAEDKGDKSIFGISMYIVQGIVTDDLTSGEIVKKPAHTQKRGIEDIMPVFENDSEIKEK